MYSDLSTIKEKYIFKDLNHCKGKILWYVDFFIEIGTFLNT